ncbi:hypothetical protein D3C78_1864210 [compost metagenome]
MIQHGVNGYLCEARNVKELSELLKKIHSMSFEDKLSIAMKAHETASELTDQKVALSYLTKIGLK